MGITFYNKPIPEPYTIYVQNFDFERYLEYAHEDINCELLDGVLTIHSPASLEHELIFKFLLNMLDLYTQERELGIVLGSRFTMKLSETWAPEPDIILIRSKDEDRLKKSYLDGPATALFEILSPSTREDDLNKKLPKYLESDVKEVWIIDPDQKTLTLHWQDGTLKVFKKDDWAKSKVINGFRLNVSWLWETKSISVLDKFRELTK